MNSSTEVATSPRHDVLPVSFGQEQMWFLGQLNPGYTTYNMSYRYRLLGALDVAALSGAVSLIVQRHAGLRASFGVSEGVPYQRIAAEAEAQDALQVIDLRGVPADEAGVLLEQTLDEAFGPFDLERGPLYRFRLVRSTDEEHVLAICIHHIVSDGWSIGVIVRELATAYQALLAGVDPDLPELGVEYLEHIREQRAAEGRRGWAEQLAFWEDRLAGLPTVELPSDRSRSASAGTAGDLLYAEAPAGLARALRARARERATSMYVLLAAAVDVLMCRYTGQVDIPIGTPMLGRMDPSLEDLVGMFVNLTVLRADLSGDPSFRELVAQVGEAVLDLYDNQEIPFHRVVDRVAPVREANRNPLFQVAVQLLGTDTAGSGLHLPGVSLESFPLPHHTSRFDLSLDFYESGDRLWLQCEYSSDLFDRWRIQALAGHLWTILAAAVDNMELRISEIPLLAEAERAELLAAGRGEPVPMSSDPIHVQIAEVARRAPEAIAATCLGVELSYRELEQRAGALAWYLRKAGIGHEQIVVIALDRDLDALIAMLGVLKAGAAFAMLDPRHPPARLRHQILDTGAQIVLTRKGFIDQLPEPAGWQVLPLDTDWEQVTAADETEPVPELATDSSLAYLLYTSGSTGKPKGVLVDHRGLTCFAQTYRQTFGFCPDDRMLQLPAITFDMSHGEIFTALTAGATLVLVSYEEGLSPTAVADLMRRQRVTFAGFSPPMLALVDAEPYPDLKYVMSGGEALPAELVNKWNLPGRRMVNLYGPTEAVISCTEYECEHKLWQSPPPIGRIQLNRQAYVVDARNQLVPRGVPGELLIGGAEGLARGYLNAPELTAERFVADPFAPTGRVYRTGDLVRWTGDCQLEFLGRTDSQVKLRGLRIELGEIESALLDHPGIQLATVLLRTDPRGNDQLVAYYVPAGDRAPSTGELTDYLTELLPSYMIPAAWVQLDKVPLTAARKIDRAQLPAPEAWRTATSPTSHLPSNPTQHKVAEVYAELLGLSTIEPTDNLFGLGGNSLMAMRASNQLNQTFGVRVSIRSIYGRTTTVADVAEAIDTMLAKKVAAVQD